jgi:hypothetical protein
MKPEGWNSLHDRALAILTESLLPEEWMRLKDLQKFDPMDGKLFTALSDLRWWDYAEEKRDPLPNGCGEYVYFRRAQEASA